MPVLSINNVAMNNNFGQIILGWTMLPGFFGGITFIV
jgi:hypothetical protein